MAPPGGVDAEIAAYRKKWIPKVWFFTYNIGACFMLPFVNLFYRQVLGFSEQQIGILSALKPFISAPAGNLVVSFADKCGLHTTIVLATYLVLLFGRGFIALATSYGAQVFLALLTEACASPMGIITDAAIVASQTDEGGYGRQRMWASIGWGGMSPMAGAVVASFGLKAAFAAYFVLVSLAFIPTCLLPISVLSVPKKGGPGSVGSGSGEADSQGAGSTKMGAGAGVDEIEVQASRGSQGSGRLVLSPQERRARMDSDLASKQGSKQNLLSALEASVGGAVVSTGSEPNSEAQQQGQQHLGHQWSISAGQQQQQAEEQGQSLALPYGVVQLSADARCPTEQLQEIVDGFGAGGSKAAVQSLSVSRQSAEVGTAGSPLLRQKARLADDADSLAHSSTTTTAAGGTDVNSSEGGSVLAGVRALLSDVHVVIFFFLAFCMGIGNGAIGFLFLYLDELGATGTLMGLCLTANCLAEVPVFYFSGSIIERLGVEPAFKLAMCAYILRVCCYIALPLLPSVWLVLGVELLQGCTFALAWSSGCVYVKRIAPVWLRSTVQSIFQGLYAGIGAGIGGLLGGFLYGMFGAGVLYKAAAVTLLAGLAIASLVPQLAAKLGAGRYQGYKQLEEAEGEQAEGEGAGHSGGS